MRRLCLLIAATFVTLSCGDSSGPGGTRAGLTLVSGYNLTDTVNAKPAQALVVEVRDNAGALVPTGTVVRFTAVLNTYWPEMTVAGLTSQFYQVFTTAETDAAGRAAVLVQMGTVAGPARIAISVPTLGVEDTARFTVLPGRPAAILMLPLDTSMYTSGSYKVRGGVVDQFNNVRNDPVVYSSQSPAVSVSNSGVVTASALGRYTLTGTAGGVSGTSGVSVVPQGTVAGLVYGNNGLHIVTFNLDGSGFHDVVGLADNWSGPRPHWLRGSSTIIYTDIVNGMQQMRTVDASGNVATLLPNPPATMTHQVDPSPSANASVLYFSALDSRCSYWAYCLFRSAIDGTNPELLGDVIAPGEQTSHASTSPDGSKVAFVTGAAQLEVFDYATRTVSAWSVTGNYPAWSPDGMQIAYEEPYGGPLHFINADGTNPRVITGSRRYFESSPSWSPDSKWLIAQSADYGTLDIIDVATGNILPIGNPPGYRNVSWK